MKLNVYIKQQGIKSVRLLAEFVGCRPETLNGWYNDDEKREQLLDPSIKRYIKRERGDA